jgi:4-hydroxybenzoyl-CoA thioesterase
MMEQHRIFVEWGDTDAAGIVFFPNFYKWMDESTHAFFRELGLSTADLMNEMNVSIPILEAHCEFKTALRSEDELIIETTLEILKPKVIKLHHKFTRDGHVIATGYTVRCWTLFGDVPKSVPMPTQIEALLQQKGFVFA